MYIELEGLKSQDSVLTSLSIGRKLMQLKENQGLHDIIMVFYDSNSNRSRFGR